MRTFTRWFVTSQTSDDTVNKNSNEHINDHLPEIFWFRFNKLKMLIDQLGKFSQFGTHGKRAFIITNKHNIYQIPNWFL